MIGFDLKAFLHANLISIKTVANETGIQEATLYLVQKRGTIKPETLGKLQESYPDVLNFKTVGGELITENNKRV